jgi:hypothetical protein
VREDGESAEEKRGGVEDTGRRGGRRLRCAVEREDEAWWSKPRFEEDGPGGWRAGGKRGKD